MSEKSWKSAVLGLTHPHHKEPSSSLLMFYEAKEDHVHLTKASHCFLDPVALANAGLVKTD